MPQVEDIEKAVKNLSDVGLQRFRRWFASFDAEVWDTQIEEDATSGKLDALASSAIADHQSGNTQEL